MPDVTLLRFSGEISTKAKVTRQRFERRLVRNVRDALRAAGVEAEVRRTHDRVYVDCGRPEASEVLARVFGIQSLAAAEEHPVETLEALVQLGAELFRDVVAGRRFAVRARRVGDRALIPFRAQDLERELGAALDPISAGVDLGAPEVRVEIELHEGRAYLVSEQRQGPGGLPYGVEGRAVALVSGGFDSAVAAWQLLRRGVALDYVLCNLGGLAHRLGAARVTKVLADRWSFGGSPQLHVVDFEGVARDIRERSEARYWQILLKRQMLRAAELISRERAAAALVTGEAVGQVSSQTLPNLAVISQATSMPILRPLVGMNKDEIIRQAERIGTAELSAVVGEYCAMVPRRPATAASLESILDQETNLNDAVVKRAVAGREVLDLRYLDVEKLGIPELEISEIPEGAVLIDLRSKPAFEAWHHPAALRLDFDRALSACAVLERGRTYVVYCEFGLKSAHLAERMRAEGLDAFHFRGGIDDLMRLAGATPAALLPVDPSDR